MVTMEWLKLFALLVAVASVQAEGAKKKIRIHLPQKVKHIHHHKKIYITNHPASSQYAPGFLSSAEGAVALPSNLVAPAVESLGSTELYEPGISSEPSKLLPLYHARGYYGPKTNEWNDQEFDLVPPAISSDHSYMPSPYAAPPAASASSNYPSKKIKYIKLKEKPHLIIRRKPKRIVIRGRPHTEEEHPVSTFHEQFYSDLESAGTIRKIKKPQRVEKIIDGDTEHIHTYSEEHIHKVLYDDGSPKLPGMGGVDPTTGMASLSPLPPHLPLKHASGLVPLPDSVTGFSVISPIGAPSQLEYNSYNPRDVTHDHIFHDHGELPRNVDLTKNLDYPPKVSYNSQGVRVVPKRYGGRYAAKYLKPKLQDGFSYYESIYSPSQGPRKVRRPAPGITHAGNEARLADFRPLPPVKYNENLIGKHAIYGPQKLSDYRQQGSAPSPFSVSSTVVHDYKPYEFGRGFPTGYSKFNNPLFNFKDSFASNFEFDSYASPSNLFEDKHENLVHASGKKGKKSKSVSTQNISFGGKDLQTMVDHRDQSNFPSGSSAPSAAGSDFEENSEQFKLSDAVSSTAYTIKETSPAHQYYTAMAIQALHNEPLTVGDSTNDNFQYVEAPKPSATPYPTAAPTTPAAPEQFLEMSTEPAPTDSTEYLVVTRPNKRSKQKYSLYQSTKAALARAHRQRENKHDYSDSTEVRGLLKYGDKI